MRSPVPSFVFGLPRSGTTLLSVMLNNHPSIHCPPEPWIMLALEALGRTHPAHPAGAGLIGTGYQAFLPEAQRIKALRVFARALYQEKLQVAGKGHFIDKTPRYYCIFDFIRKVFPTAKSLFLVRNPLDVAASYKNSWGVDLALAIRQQSDTPHAMDFVLGLELLAKESRRKNKNTYTLCYESLTRNPAAALSSLVSFLGFPIHENIEQFDLEGSAYKEHGLGDRNVLATTAPHQESIGKWRTTFNKNELAILLTAIGRDTLVALGYAAIANELRDMGVRDKGMDYCQYTRDVYALHRDKRLLQITGDCLYEAGPGA